MLRRLAAVALCAAGISAAAPASAQPVEWLPLDAFYTPPAAVPPEPGALVRSERLTNRVLPPGAQAWRIMYTTTLPGGSPVTAVATVLAPQQLPQGPRPVVMWNHGTEGIQQRCMPSTTTAPFTGVPALDQVVSNGWVVVAADYAPNKNGVHAYLDGEGEARSSLDAVRAAGKMPELTFAPGAAVWGHSQGGHAALWVGIHGPRYAPDVQLAGVAAFAPVTDIAQMIAMNGGNTAAAHLGAYLVEAYSQYYPDVWFDDVVAEADRSTARQLAGLCQFDPADFTAEERLTDSLFGRPVIADPGAGAMNARMRANVPDRPINVPVVIVQGLDDAVIIPMITDTFVDQRCAAGQDIEYWRLPGHEHGDIVLAGSPAAAPLISWTRDRFSGVPQGGCQIVTVG